jgi:hypothetical protein
MTEMDRFSQLANQLQAEEPELPLMPIPYHARANTNGYYVCGPMGCGKLFTDVASLRRHRAEFCRSYRESERPMSNTRLMGG